MPPRIPQDQIKALLPDVYSAIGDLDDRTRIAELDHALLELVKLRCSQLNGCAYCVQYHTRLLLEAGMSPDRISLVPAWAETDVFTARERAALRWGEELTELPETHASDAAYAEVAAVFTERERTALTAAIAVINVWNRMAVGFRFDPPYPV
jgi:AhpD family alkylhydroperoxidase